MTLAQCFSLRQLTDAGNGGDCIKFSGPGALILLDMYQSGEHLRHTMHRSAVAVIPKPPVGTRLTNNQASQFERRQSSQQFMR